MRAGAASLAHRLMLPLAWTAYVVLPIAGWGVFEGAPLTPLSVAALCAVWWIWATRETLGLGRAIIILIFLKLVLGWPLLAERGFEARYYANPSWSPSYERSLDFPRLAATRLDRRLKFDGRERRDLPLFFQNDLRFNFYQPDQPQRDKLPFSTEWSGSFEAGRAEEQTFYLTGEGVTAELAIDGRPVVALPSDGHRAVGALALQAGWHAVVIRLSSPYGAQRRFEAGRIDPDSRRDRPLDDTSIFTQPVPAFRILLDRLIRWGSRTADMLLLAALAWWCASALSWCLRTIRAGEPATDIFPRAVTALLWLAVCVDAFLFALPASGRLVLLGGGGDPLTYEFFARDIVLHGPLMLLGAPAGRAAPFYYQPLYPYALAAIHDVFGESFFGIYFLQRLLIAVTAFSLARTATLLFDRTTGRVTFFVGVLFLYVKAGPWANVLLGESLFMPLVAIWVQLLITAAVDRPGVRSVLRAGLIGGIATLSRSTLLLSWLLVVPAWWLAIRRRSSTPLRWVALLAFVMLAVTSVATLRNWIAAHRFVPVSTSFSINLFLGNEPPASVRALSSSRRPLYDALGLEDTTRAVLEYARVAPRAFAHRIGQKTIYALGLFDLSGLTPSATGSVPYVAVWLVALGGLIAALTVRDRSVPAAAIGLPALAAVGHLLSVIAIFPNIYGDRLILPFYVLVLPYVGFAVVRLTPRVQLADPRVRTALLAGLLGAAMSGIGGDALVFGLSAILLVAALTVEPPPALHRRHVLYIAWLATLTASALIAPLGPSPAEYWRQVLFLVTAFSVARLFRSERALDLIVAGLLFVAGAWALVEVRRASGLPPAARAGASQIWIWHSIGDIIRNGSRAWGAGLGAITADERGIEIGTAGRFITVAAESGIVGLVCFLALWARVMGISFAGALRGHWRAAGMYAVLLTLFVLSHGIGGSQASLTDTGMLVFSGIAFGVTETLASNHWRSALHDQDPPTVPISTAGPRSSPIATPT